jgi:hypothetical protein
VDAVPVDQALNNDPKIFSLDKAGKRHIRPINFENVNP